MSAVRSAALRPLSPDLRALPKARRSAIVGSYSEVNLVISSDVRTSGVSNPTDGARSGFDVIKARVVGRGLAAIESGSKVGSGNEAGSIVSGGPVARKRLTVAHRVR